MLEQGGRGCWLLVVGCWLLVVGCWLLVGAVRGAFADLIDSLNVLDVWDWSPPRVALCMIGYGVEGVKCLNNRRSGRFF